MAKKSPSENIAVLEAPTETDIDGLVQKIVSKMSTADRLKVAQALDERSNMKNKEEILKKVMEYAEKKGLDLKINADNFKSALESALKKELSEYQKDEEKMIKQNIKDAQKETYSDVREVLRAREGKGEMTVQENAKFIVRQLNERRKDITDEDRESIKKSLVKELEYTTQSANNENETLANMSGLEKTPYKEIFKRLTYRKDLQKEVLKLLKEELQPKKESKSTAKGGRYPKAAESAQTEAAPEKKGQTAKEIAQGILDDIDKKAENDNGWAQRIKQSLKTQVIDRLLKREYKLRKDNKDDEVAQKILDSIVVKRYKSNAPKIFEALRELIQIGQTKAKSQAASQKQETPRVEKISEGSKKSDEIVEKKDSLKEGIDFLTKNFLKEIEGEYEGAEDRSKKIADLKKELLLYIDAALFDDDLPYSRINSEANTMAFLFFNKMKNNTGVLEAVRKILSDEVKSIFKEATPKKKNVEVDEAFVSNIKRGDRFAYQNEIFIIIDVDDQTITLGTVSKSITTQNPATIYNRIEKSDFFRKMKGELVEVNVDEIIDENIKRLAVVNKKLRERQEKEENEKKERERPEREKKEKEQRELNEALATPPKDVRYNETYTDPRESIKVESLNEGDFIGVRTENNSVYGFVVLSTGQSKVTVKRLKIVQKNNTAEIEEKEESQLVNTILGPERLIQLNSGFLSSRIKSLVVKKLPLAELQKSERNIQPLISLNEVVSGFNNLSMNKIESTRERLIQMQDAPSTPANIMDANTPKLIIAGENNFTEGERALYISRNGKEMEVTVHTYTDTPKLAHCIKIVDSKGSSFPINKERFKFLEKMTAEAVEQKTEEVIDDRLNEKLYEIAVAETKLEKARQESARQKKKEKREQEIAFKKVSVASTAPVAEPKPTQHTTTNTLRIPSEFVKNEIKERQMLPVEIQKIYRKADLQLRELMKSPETLSQFIPQMTETLQKVISNFPQAENLGIDNLFMMIQLSVEKIIKDLKMAQLEAPELTNICTEYLRLMKTRSSENNEKKEGVVQGPLAQTIQQTKNSAANPIKMTG